MDLPKLSQEYSEILSSAPQIITPFIWMGWTLLLSSQSWSQVKLLAEPNKHISGQLLEILSVVPHTFTGTTIQIFNHVLKFFLEIVVNFPSALQLCEGFSHTQSGCGCGPQTTNNSSVSKHSLKNAHRCPCCMNGNSLVGRMHTGILHLMALKNGQRIYSMYFPELITSSKKINLYSHNIHQL